MADFINQTISLEPKYWLLRFGVAVFLPVLRSPSTVPVDDVVGGTSTPPGASGDSFTTGGTVDNTFRQLRRRDRQ